MKSHLCQKNFFENFYYLLSLEHWLWKLPKVTSNAVDQIENYAAQILMYVNE